MGLGRTPLPEGFPEAPWPLAGRGSPSRILPLKKFLRYLIFFKTHLDIFML